MTESATPPPEFDPIDLALHAALRKAKGEPVPGGRALDVRARLLAAGYEIRPRAEVVGYVELSWSLVDDSIEFMDGPDDPAIFKAESVDRISNSIDRTVALASKSSKPTLAKSAVAEVRLVPGEAWR